MNIRLGQILSCNIFLNLFRIISILLAACCLQSCTQQKSSQNNQNRPLIFGMLPADAPFMAVNQHGQYEGFDVDVAREIGKTLNREIQIIDMGMAELLIAIDRKKIDLLMCGFSITNARLEHFNLVHYQGTGVKTFPLVFWNQAPHNVTSMENLRDHNLTIAVLPGTLQEKFAQQFDFITTKAINSYADIVLELQYGKVNAALFDEAIETYVRRFPQFHVINVPIGNFESLGHGIAIHKTNRQLTQDVEQTVQLLKSNGTIARLEATWQLNGVSND